MYKNVRCWSQFWTDLHEIQMAGAGPPMDELYCFWKQSAPENHWYGRKGAPKTGFSAFILNDMGFSEGKELKTIFNTLFPTEKIILIFVIRGPISSKMVMPYKKLFFAVMLEN